MQINCILKPFIVTQTVKALDDDVVQPFYASSLYRGARSVKIFLWMPVSSYPIAPKHKELSSVGGVNSHVIHLIVQLNDYKTMRCLPLSIDNTLADNLT
jgi:hypothetical protein